MVTNIAIADLRQRVTLQRRSESPDGQGGKTITWPTRAVLWAAVNDGAGREQLEGEGLLTAQAPSTVVIRYRADVSVKDRIVWGTRMLDVAGIEDVDGRRDFLRLLCTEVRA